MLGVNFTSLKISIPWWKVSFKERCVVDGSKNPKVSFSPKIKLFMMICISQIQIKPVILEVEVPLDLVNEDDEGAVGGGVEGALGGSVTDLVCIDADGLNELDSIYRGLAVDDELILGANVQEICAHKCRLGTQAIPIMEPFPLYLSSIVNLEKFYFHYKDDVMTFMEIIHKKYSSMRPKELMSSTLSIQAGMLVACYFEAVAQ